MEKVIVKRLIRHFVNSFVKIPAKFLHAEIKKTRQVAATQRKKEKLYSSWFRKTLKNHERNEKHERRDHHSFNGKPLTTA